MALEEESLQPKYFGCCGARRKEELLVEEAKAKTEMRQIACLPRRQRGKEAMSSNQVERKNGGAEGFIEDVEKQRHARKRL